jgi:hypothetical protein
MSGLGQSSRTLGCIILGGPRAGAGSSIRIYNFYNSLPEPTKSQFFAQLNKNASYLYNKNGGYLLNSIT